MTADTRVRELLPPMNDAWKRVFEQLHRPWNKARYLPYTGTPVGGCQETPAFAGKYCHDIDTILVDVRFHWSTDDDGLQHVLAHEMGHHVSGLLHGWRSGVKAELFADCLSGVWARATRRGPRNDDSFEGDAGHGTAAQQSRWFARGYAHARPADCEAVWADAG